MRDEPDPAVTNDQKEALSDKPQRRVRYTSRRVHPLAPHPHTKVAPISPAASCPTCPALAQGQAPPWCVRRYGSIAPFAGALIMSG